MIRLSSPPHKKKPKKREVCCFWISRIKIVSCLIVKGLIVIRERVCWGRVFTLRANYRKISSLKANTDRA